MTDNQNTPEKQNIPEELIELKDAMRTYVLPAALAVLIAALIFAARGAWISRKNNRAAEASTLLLNAKQASGIEEKVRRLEDIVSQYSSTPSAPLAMLAIAKAYYNEGKSDIAMARYDDFLKSYPDHRFSAGAVLGRLHCLESLGSLYDALAGYRKFKAQNPSHFLTPQAELGEIRCLTTMARKEEARIACEDIMASRPETLWAMKARQTLDELGDSPDGPESPADPEEPSEETAKEKASTEKGAEPDDREIESASAMEEEVIE